MFDQETEETLSYSNTRANIVTKEDLNGCHLCLSLHNFTLPRGKHKTAYLESIVILIQITRTYLKYFPSHPFCWD